MAELYSVSKAADLLGRDRRTLAKMIDNAPRDGTEAGQPRYSLKTIVNAMIAYEVAGKSATNPKTLDLSSERARLAREQAESAAMKNAQQRGELVAIEHVQATMEAAFTIVRERLLTIPGKLADNLVAREREEIEDALREEISDALTELHEPDEHDFRSRVAAAGGTSGDGGSQTALDAHTH